jgi:hypothetical protein
MSRPAILHSLDGEVVFSGFDCDPKEDAMPLDAAPSHDTARMAEHTVTSSHTFGQPDTTRGDTYSAGQVEGLRAFRCNGTWYEEYWHQPSPATDRPILARLIGWLRDAPDAIGRLRCALTELLPDAGPAPTKFLSKTYPPWLSRG